MKEKFAKIRIVFSVLALLWVGLFLFGERGIVALWRLEKECKKLEASIVLEKQSYDSLLVIQERLKTDSSYIQRQVRSQLGYIDSGETVIKFITDGE